MFLMSTVGTSITVRSNLSNIATEPDISRERCQLSLRLAGGTESCMVYGDPILCADWSSANCTWDTQHASNWPDINLWWTYFFSQSSHFQYLDYNSVTYYMRNASFGQQSTAMLLCGALPLRFCPSCTDSYSLVFNALASFLKCLQHLRTAPWCKTSLSNIFIYLRLNCAALWPSRDKHFTIGRRLLTQRKLIWFSLK